MTFLFRPQHNAVSRGEYLTTIARDLKLNYKTVRKYALADECPTTEAYPPRPHLLTPYEPYLQVRWAEGCWNGLRLYDELVVHGFRGSRTVVADFVARLRRATRAGYLPAPIAREDTPLTPHSAAYLLLRRPERRSAAACAAIAQLSASHPEVATVIVFTERFTAIVRERRGGKLGTWRTDAATSGLRELRQFALKMRKDEDAVKGGLHAELIERTDGRPDQSAQALKATDVRAGEVRFAPAADTRSRLMRRTKTLGHIIGGFPTVSRFRRCIAGRILHLSLHPDVHLGRSIGFRPERRQPMTYAHAAIACRAGGG